MWPHVSHSQYDRFTAIVERHVAHLHDYCRALLTDRQEAADAALATLVLACSLLDRLEDTGRVRAWLLALARRECRHADPVRSQLRARIPGWPPAAPGADDWHPRSGPGQTAGATLDDLPAMEREVLDLVYRHYLSSADVAAVLGESASGASALLAAAVTNFELAHERYADAAGEGVQPWGARGVLLTGVRAVSTIPLMAPPPSILADAFSIVADADFAAYREALASTIGSLGPDGFPLPQLHPDGRRRDQPLRDWVVARYALLRRAGRPVAVLDKARHIPSRRLAVVGGVLVALAAAFAAIASSPSGVPKAISRAIGQALGQGPAGSPTGSIRRIPIPLPITSLLPKKHDKGIVLPMLPTVRAAPGSRSPRNPPPGSPSATTGPVTPSPTPTPTSPSPTPASPSPTPTSPSPTPSSPPPTPTASP